MDIVLLILAGFLGNAVLGAIVLAAIDRDGRLFAWYRSAPSDVLKVIVLEFWFVVAFLFLKPPS